MPHVQLNPGSTPSKKIVTGAVPVSVLADYFQVAATAVGQAWDLDLVTEQTDPNGTVRSITDSRRAVGKKVKIQNNVLQVSFADVDLDKLTSVYPSKTYTVADFSRLYVEHVGRPIPDLGPGTQLKVPMTLISDGGGTGPWLFAYAENRAAATFTVPTIYRSGQVVPSSEYTFGTTTGASSGVVVRHVSFVREQRNTSNQLYTLEADVSVTGNREPSAELSRILTALGVSIDAASFTTAQAVDNAFGIFCDAGYVRPRTAARIIEDLLRMARADLIKSTAGAWALVQDKTRASVATYAEASSLVRVDSYEQPELPVEVIANFRPGKAGEDNGWLFPPQKRTLGGAGRTLTLDLPYCYDGTVADRLCDYYSKRARLWRGSFDVMAAQWDSGDMITIDGLTCWYGLKSFVPRGITRISDGNAIDGVEYDASIYTYTAGTVPSGAANTYAADFANTPPAAPSGLSVVSQGTNQATAYALIRVTTPPATNWAFLVAQIRNTGTNEIYQARLDLNGGNYEATITGLKTGSAHSVIAYAVNGNNIQGVATSAVNFTSNGVAAYIADSHITTAGVNAASIGTSAINQTRSNTSTGSISTATLAAAGGVADVSIDVFCFFPSFTTPIGSSGQIYLLSSVVTKVGAGDISRFRCRNDHPSTTGRVDIDYRIFNT